MEKKEYTAAVNARGLFNNSFDSLIPQTVVAHTILNHFNNCTKKPKCLFIGWDGCRADAMKYIVKSDDEMISGCNTGSPYSAVTQLKKSGGLYASYVGGDADSRQETSTAQGWATALCGKWMKPEWRQGINWGVDDSYPTVLRTLALQGYNTSFTAIWDIHFKNTYKYEIDMAQSQNIQQYFYQMTTDEQLLDNMKERIAAGDDMVFGIIENPDMNGHALGFGDCNYRYVAGVAMIDCLSYNLIQTIKDRKTYAQEDWLIIICSDHGGHKRSHGTQKIQDRTTFIASSKKID